jgi:hypothetical protein
VVPRANTTSTSGQGSADADGTGAVSSAEPAAATTPTQTTMLRPFTAQCFHTATTAANRKANGQ